MGHYHVSLGLHKLDQLLHESLTTRRNCATRTPSSTIMNHPWLGDYQHHSHQYWAAVVAVLARLVVGAALWNPYQYYLHRYHWLPASAAKVTLHPAV